MLPMNTARLLRDTTLAFVGAAPERVMRWVKGAGERPCRAPPGGRVPARPPGARHDVPTYSRLRTSTFAGRRVSRRARRCGIRCSKCRQARALASSRQEAKRKTPRKYAICTYMPLCADCLKRLEWARLDSNQRRHKPTGLQPVSFGHSDTRPNARHYSTPVGKPRAAPQVDAKPLRAGRRKLAARPISGPQPLCVSLRPGRGFYGERRTLTTPASSVR